MRVELVGGAWEDWSRITISSMWLIPVRLRLVDSDSYTETEQYVTRHLKHMDILLWTELVELRLLLVVRNRDNLPTLRERCDFLGILLIQTHASQCCRHVAVPRIFSVVVSMWRFSAQGLEAQLQVMDNNGLGHG